MSFNLRRYITNIFLLITFALLQNSYGQLSGTYTIPGSPFATIRAAVDSMNLAGVGAGGVTFNVTAGYTENITEPIIVTATGTEGNTITLQKSGSGADPLVTRTDAGTNETINLGGLGDAVIQLNGSDYVTFDGIDVSASNQGIEYGYITNKPSGTDGCKYVTIKNAAVTMTKGTSGYVIGIYISNGPTDVASPAGVAVTDSSGINSNILITGNTVQNVHVGVYERGSVASGFQDNNVVVGQEGAGNVITNFGGGSATPSYGVYNTLVANPTVSYNTITSAEHTANVYGIYYLAGIQGNVVANNNTITLSNVSLSTGATYYIYTNANATSESFNNNTFAAGTISATGNVYLIYTQNFTTSITVTGNQTSGSINRTGALGNFYCYYNFGSPTSGLSTISNNNFSNITVTGTSGLYGIYDNTFQPHNRICSGNTIANLAGGTGNTYCIYTGATLTNQLYDNTVHSVTAGGNVYGLYFAGPNATAYNNNVYEITTSGTILYGIYDAAAGTTSCYKNQVYNLTGNNANQTLYGIYITSGASNNVYNNFVSDLKTPVSGSATGLAGMYISGGTAIGLYYNTIFLNASSTGANFGSAGIYASTTPTVDLRDNVVVNTSTPVGAGFTTAYRRSTNTLTSYADVSNNNDFYAGTPSAVNLIYYDGTDTARTIEQFKIIVSPRDSVSFTENPPFENSTTPPYDLHINTNAVTQLEAGGTPVNTPIAITDDFDGDLRNASTPDVGADEFVTLLQLSGTYTIPGSPFATIKAAVDSLNLVGVGSGGVTFNVTAGYTENITEPIIVTASGTEGNTIILQKSGSGADPLVTRTDAGTNETINLGGLGDAVIQLNGSDYVTFDGIDVSASNQGIEYGYITNKPSGTDGCKNVTIKNAAVTMTKGTSGYVIGIYVSNGPTDVASPAGVTITDSSGINSDIIITGNTVQNVHVGVYARGSGASGFQDNNVVIGQTGAGNIITNFGGGSMTPSYGVYITYVTNPSVAYNTITSAEHTANLFGVDIFAGVQQIVVNNNTITLSNVSLSTGATYYIANYSTGASENFNNNTFAAGTISATGSVYLIYASTFTTSVTVTGNQTSGSINRTGAVGNFYCYYNFGTPTSGLSTISNNNFSNITVTGSSNLYGFYDFVIGTHNRICNDNTIENFTGGTGNTYGFYHSGGLSNEIYNNTVHNITAGGNVWGIYGTGTNGSFHNNNVYNITTSGINLYGIYDAATGTTNCYKNQVYNLTGNNANQTLYGIYITTGASNNVYNNFVSDLKTPVSGSATGLAGMYISGGTAIGLYYNTIFLNASSTGANFGSAGIYASTTPTVDLRDNVVVNTSTPVGAGFTTAYRRSTNTLTSYADVSNNNDFYAGTPSAVNLIYYDGTDTARTIEQFKMIVSPRDSVSFTENPPFINSTTPPYDLHINITVPTQLESGGTPVNTPIAITDDFDGDLRDATTPDVGADEFESVGTITFSLSLNINDGWNMTSVPGTNPDGMDITNWWADLTGTVYKFVPGSGYSGITTTTPGEGYWMKNAGTETYNYPSLQVVTHNPISASSGWNMFGGYENSEDVTTLTSTPPDQIVYPIYKYVPGAGYQNATTLDPGYGYWIKVLSDCQINTLVVPANLSKNAEKYFKDNLANGQAGLPISQVNWGKITVTDATGSSYTLYAVKGQVDLNKYELPPLPPAGVFDVRYNSGRIAEDINSGFQTIDMSGVKYPVKVKADGMDIRIQDVTGKEINVNVKKGEEITISNPNVNKLMVSGQLIPDKYALEQNYPNPFNPSTTIEFSLPENVKNATISIYNVLGQKVAELINGEMLAGKYQYQWNAKNYASGMYIYELRTEKFVSIKKMMLLK